ncbi:MAG: ABC transporter permease subunit [Gammaproteobacteria bacterium]|nr:ABC transporter permease subunit [Gammaproteobacteria bacterium]
MEKASESPLFDAANERRYQWRLMKDAAARRAVGVGGVGVIIAILLIFFYLVYVVYPLFVPASAGPVADYPVPGGSSTLHVEAEESGELAVRYTADGRAVFFRLADGAVVKDQPLIPTGGATVSALTAPDAAANDVALGLSDGRVLPVRHGFALSYPNDQRTITPALAFPYGEAALTLDDRHQPLQGLAVRDGEEALLMAATTADGRLLLVTFAKQTDFLSDETTLERSAVELRGVPFAPRFLLITPDQRWLYVASETGELTSFDLSDTAAPRHTETVRLVKGKAQLTSLRFLIGGYSLLAGSSDGRIAQWFPVRDDQNINRLTFIRGFQQGSAPVQALAVEQRRKGFVAADAQGRVGFYNTTANASVLTVDVVKGGVSALTISPRADALLAEGKDGRVHVWQVHNEHPEVSWSALWEKVHYEGYSQPEYVWQSSAANNDFEPKFSLTPLAFGTLKAAFYAMLFAAPLAILGAIYTAYFMAPRMRTVVKPTIEIMEALPTVILGFLAGLWLAPFFENHLPGVFALLVVAPFGVLAFAFVWSQLPLRIRSLVPEGWEAALLVPVLLFIGWFALSLSLPMEQLFFNGDMRAWLDNTFGIGFDQRNALVVGIAMGFAVIPNIFSIAEDAIFSVPKHLTFGSLALGATPWQTLSRVVILTASPGIFSALMIGLGRAVGETMIVLMATGNTPVMDLSIFQGMRTLSANVAVEMPESEVASTHYRILFLAALVLFMFTFAFNTVAEIVRQRLRKKYSSL